ncbi:MAG: roadblock/LC7 domain-containing protein [Cyanobacteria bacterium REEB67]|nr:roadblock/LC7 domain-containing protein [Cyanobacteria bacterium REEB67]
MTCNRFRTLVQQRFDQDLETQDHRALINHLEGCESCAKFDHQLDQMIQAAQDTPAPDEVRPQNPEALARQIMEQLPQKKGSLVNMILGMFSGGSKTPKAPKAAKGGKDKGARDMREDGGSVIKDKLKAKTKGKSKDSYTDKEPDMRPGGVSFGRKKDDQIDNAAIESQVGTFSRLKSISSNRGGEQLDREAQSTTRSLGEKFGMPGSNTILDEGPLTLAESIKRKVSESQKMSPLDGDDGEASGSLVPVNDNGAGSPFGRGDASAGDGNWGPPAFGAKQSMSDMPAAATQVGGGMDWGGGAARSGSAPNFAAPTPIGFDEHPGSSIGLAPPGGRRPDLQEGAGKAGIGLSSAAPAQSAGWGASDNAKAADNSSAWGGAPAASPTAAVPTPAASTWTSGWGSESAQPVPQKSSDSWAVPGSDSTASWGQAENTESGNQAGSAPSAPASAQGMPAQENGSDPWGAPAAAAWGAGQAAADAANAVALASQQTLPTGTPAPATPSNDAWGAPSGAAPAASDAWGAPAVAQEAAWGGAPAASPQPGPAIINEVAETQPATANADAWGAPAQTPAQATPANDAWGAPAQTPAPATPANDAWGAPAQTPAPATPANDAWGAAAPATSSSDAWNAAASTSSTAGDAWGAAPQAAGQAGPEAAGDAWTQPAPAPDQPPITGVMATGYATIPPGQFATPANAGSAIASSGWGQAPVPPATLDAAQIEAKKNAWSAEAEQLETGTWRAFAPKMNADLGAKAPAAPPAAPPGDRWDVPIQERAKTGAEQSNAAMPAMPPAPVTPAQAAAPADTQGRWDVPIQERSKQEEAAPVVGGTNIGMNIGMPPGAVGNGAPVLSSGIPVNQIVEKMGQVLGGQSQGASAGDQESRWDVPIQERVKSSQEIAPVQAVQAAPQAFQNAPAPSWGQPAPVEMPASPPPAVDNNAWGAPAPANSWGQEAAPAAPAAPSWESTPASAGSGWGSGDGVPLPTAQPTSTWGQPATSGWGDPPAAANNQAAPAISQSQTPLAGSGWGTPADPANGGQTNGGSAWGQPPAPVATGWGAPPPPAPEAVPSSPPQAAPRAEITDKVQGGGLLTGIDDKAIDRIFGEIGVQESVSKTVVNSGGEPVSNFSPPTSAAPQFMEAQPQPAPAPAPSFAQTAAPEAPVAKGLLGGIDDKAIDRIFSQNLGVSESSVPVGRGAEMAGAPAMASAAAASSWGNPPAPAVPTAPAQSPAEVAQSNGWGAPLPPASSGWGMPPSPMPDAPSEAAPPAASGWGTPPAAPGQWGMPPAPMAAPAQPALPDAAAMAQANFGQAAAGGAPKLFSVDDSVMDRIFSENLGIPQDGQPGQVAAAPVHQTMPEMQQPAAPFTSGPPPKIAGIGRLDSNADPNQDAGSGRIASIGKFLLDQKDLDKIGKLTNTDNNDGKLRILTKENSDDLQALLGQIGAQVGVLGSVIVGHDGLLIANTMPPDMDAESVGVWALGVYMNTEHVTKKMGHDRVHQVVSRTPRGYVIIADFGGGLLVCVTEGTSIDSLIPLMRTITQLVN